MSAEQTSVAMFFITILGDDETVWLGVLGILNVISGNNIRTVLSLASLFLYVHLYLICKLLQVHQLSMNKSFGSQY